ncbi:MAG: 16S rRNA (guanine(966)-N(2))-methyltransferase RsmD [Thiotrichales bacterium]
MIGGEWRGRKVSFHAADGLRPTGDRIRETLFNWIQPGIEGAETLDLFTGSGALSFEALSRGAKLAVMVEPQYQTVRDLQTQVANFNAEKSVIWHGSAEDYLSTHRHAFDFVFVDPPFAAPEYYGLLNHIVSGGFVKEDGLIYVEYPVASVPELPSGWTFFKQKKSGDVGYGLLAHKEENA